MYFYEIVVVFFMNKCQMSAIGAMHVYVVRRCGIE